MSMWFKIYIGIIIIIGFGIILAGCGFATWIMFDLWVETQDCGLAFCVVFGLFLIFGFMPIFFKLVLDSLIEDIKGLI